MPNPAGHSRYQRKSHLRFIGLRRNNWLWGHTFICRCRDLGGLSALRRPGPRGLGYHNTYKNSGRKPKRHSDVEQDGVRKQQATSNGARRAQ